MVHPIQHLCMVVKPFRLPDGQEGYELITTVVDAIGDIWQHYEWSDDWHKLDQPTKEWASKHTL